MTVNKTAILTAVNEALSEDMSESLNEIQHHVTTIAATALHKLMSDRAFVLNLARNLSVVTLDATTMMMDRIGATAANPMLVARPIPGSKRVMFTSTPDDNGRTVVRLESIERALESDDKGIPTSWEPIEVTPEQAGAIATMMVNEGLEAGQHYYLTTDLDVEEQRRIALEALGNQIDQEKE